MTKGERIIIILLKALVLNQLHTEVSKDVLKVCERIENGGPDVS